MNDVRKGRTVVLDGEPYVVASAQFLRKQQRRPVMKTVLKHLKTGQTREHSFMQSDKIEEAEVDRTVFQFLYSADSRYTFMNQSTYDQLELGAVEVGDVARFLIEGQEVTAIIFDGSVVTVELPIKIDRTVTAAPPGVRGDTSTNVMKEVEIEGGTKVKAPLFIKEGDRIRIDTRTGEYVERA